MITLDIRFVLYALLLLILVLMSLVWWWGHHTTSREPISQRDVWEHAPVGVVLLSGPREYRWANATAQRLLDLPASQGTLPDTDWARALMADRSEARLAGESGGRYRQINVAQGRVVRWWVYPHRSGDVVLLWDVTAYHRAEEAARVLLSTLAHELRNPLSTIRTHVEVLNLPNVPPEVQRQSLNILREETGRLSRLVDQMLELGRLDMTPELDLRPTDVLTVVEQALAVLQPRAEEKGLTLNLVANTPLPAALADPERLYQVFLNLLDNALIYCRPGDTITVTLEARAESIYCEVRDTGPGIPPSHLPHITRRFYRGDKAPGQGSGLGLAIVEEILKRHGSALHIESHTQGPERGTRAFFTLRKGV